MQNLDGVSECKARLRWGCDERLTGYSQEMGPVP